MSSLNLDYLFEDPETLEQDSLPDYTSLDFVSSGSHIYGEIMWPSKNFPKPHPCVIMLHGFPGSARNDDISHALCRIGCVVLVPHHRGAWGSQGKYLVTHCVEDAKNLAENAHSKEFSEKYNVDPQRIYLLGHSMGGNSALNAGRQLEWLRGIIMLAPFDPTCFLARGKAGYIEALLNEGKILNSDGIDSIYDDIVENQDKLAFPNAFSQVKDKNILIFTGKYDSVSDNQKMVQPLWQLLQSNKTNSLQRLVEYPTEHGLLGRRISMIKEIAQFLLKTE
ncbi:MAG: alpha/beta fold hydrolase [Treponema sp.]|nr:alpha/beta fold hydrolase [Candidatus Treponema equifaecale]